MDELIKAARAILEDFDLYGQPISLRLLADLRRAVEAAQQTLAPDACPYCLGKGKEPASGVLVRCRFCAGTGKRG